MVIIIPNLIAPLALVINLAEVASQTIGPERE